jgi:hypothetical protein
VQNSAITICTLEDLLVEDVDILVRIALFTWLRFPGDD